MFCLGWLATCSLVSQLVTSAFVSPMLVCCFVFYWAISWDVHTLHFE